MARPAASSLAELILCPVARRSIVLDIVRAFSLIALAVMTAEMFVLITVIFVSSQVKNLLKKGVLIRCSRDKSTSVLDTLKWQSVATLKV
jgi:hypothetical protein